MENPNKNNATFKIGIVESVIDKTGGGRIKVRIVSDEGQRKNVTTEQMPYAFPLLPKIFHVTPKVGEAVLIFSSNLDNYNADLFYFGPLVSQLNKLNYDPESTTARSFLSSGTIEAGKNPNQNESAKGLYPNTEDVAILGRGSDDIILKDNELWVRVGKYKGENKEIFNKQDLGYIQMKYNDRVDEDKKHYNSSIIQVADKIAILTHGNKGLLGTDLTNQEHLIDNTSMENILKKAHSAGYGDLIEDLLEVFRIAFLTHSHPFPGQPPLPTMEVNRLRTYDMTSIVAKNIKIL